MQSGKVLMMQRIIRFLDGESEVRKPINTARLRHQFTGCVFCIFRERIYIPEDAIAQYIAIMEVNFSCAPQAAKKTGVSYIKIRLLPFRLSLYGLGHPNNEFHSSVMLRKRTSSSLCQAYSTLARSNMLVIFS